MKRNVYVCYDKVRESALCVFLAENDGIAIRDNAISWSKFVPLGDLTVTRVAIFDEDTKTFEAIEHVVVPFDSYKFPESPLKKDEKK